MEGNLTRMLRAVLNKSLKQYPTKPAVRLPTSLFTSNPSNTNKEIRCTAGEVRTINMSDDLLCAPTYGRASVGRPAKTRINSADPGYNFGDL